MHKLMMNTIIARPDLRRAWRHPRRVEAGCYTGDMRRRHFLALTASAAPAVASNMNSAAERYVKLVLAVGKHDPDYVDAYYGPPAWQPETKRPLAAIHEEAQALIEELTRNKPSGDEMTGLRHRFLLVQARSLARRVEMLQGAKFTFDAESRMLYDAVAPTYPASHFEPALAELEKLIPGEGALAARYETWERQFYIPSEKLDAVFRAAVEEARARTKKHITLPDGESFVIEYVKGQVWNAYNWYKGKAHSLIQVNTDLPVDIGQAVHLAAHEGYPGHHVYNALLEDRLVAQRGWLEYTAYPLYSPQSLMAEGTAEYGVELAFPKADRIEFYRQALFPQAGLDAARASEFYRVKQLAASLSHAGNQAARGYLDGRISKEDCAAYLTRYALMRPARAAQRVRFIEKNRAYVINYNLGQDLIRRYLRKRGGSPWKEFEQLLSSPRLPSGLV
jgi:hypothetical protein